jgi:hypothetical protein
MTTAPTNPPPVEDEPRLLDRAEILSIEDWADAHADPEVADRVADLIDHIVVLSELIWRPGDPSLSAAKKYVVDLVRLQQRQDTRAAHTGASSDRAYAAALKYAVTLTARQTERAIPRVDR